MMLSPHSHSFIYALILGVLSMTTVASADDPWVVYDGFDGPGKGKHVVLVSGDEEYRSEEALPQLGKILAKHHGFKCTVIFSIDPKTGAIDPNNRDNMPGLEALKTADLMVIATRFRHPKDEQMKHIADYIDAGKSVLGMRTATHGFLFDAGSKYARYTYNFSGKGWKGGFGRRILGDTWLSHHGSHKHQSTRGLIAEGMKNNPLTRGCEDIWGPTDVYGVRLPLPKSCTPVIMGQVLVGMKPSDKPLEGKKNNPMMPVTWTNSYQGNGGQEGRVFTTTMGSSTDLESEGVRRMLVNGVYWCVGMEAKIPERAKVDIVGKFKPLPYGFGGFAKGVMPAVHRMK